MYEESVTPQIQVYPTKEEAAKAAALKIIAAVRENPTATISYATGDTYVPVYALIAREIAQKTVDFSHTTAFHIDEYFPCDPGVSYGFVRYIRENVIEPFHISPERAFYINATVPDGKVEAAKYELLLTLHPVDLTVLGIGPGGHIGFNEPGSSFTGKTQFITLAAGTRYRDHVMRKLNTPDQAITQGIGTILRSKKIVQTAFGEEKGTYLKKALQEQISENCPSSALRLVGSKVTIIIDQAAGSALQR